MSTALPVQNSTNLASAPAGAIGTAVRSALAGVLTAFLKHSRSMDGSQVVFVAKDETAEMEEKSGLKMVFSRLSESHEQRETRLQMADMAEATDLYDLEFRSRQWDRKTRSM